MEDSDLQQQLIQTHQRYMLQIQRSQQLEKQVLQLHHQLEVRNNFRDEQKLIKLLRTNLQEMRQRLIQQIAAKDHLKRQLDQSRLDQRLGRALVSLKSKQEECLSFKRNLDSAFKKVQSLKDQNQKLRGKYQNLQQQLYQTKLRLAEKQKLLSSEKERQEKTQQLNSVLVKEIQILRKKLQARQQKLRFENKEIKASFRSDSVQKNNIAKSQISPRESQEAAFLAELEQIQKTQNRLLQTQLVKKRLQDQLSACQGKKPKTREIIQRTKQLQRQLQNSQRQVSQLKSKLRSLQVL